MGDTTQRSSLHYGNGSFFPCKEAHFYACSLPARTSLRISWDEVIDFLAVQIALRQKFRTHPGGVLRAAPPLCAALHGPVRPRATALPLGPLALSGERERFRPPKPCAPSFSPICWRARLPTERHTGTLVDR